MLGYLKHPPVGVLIAVAALVFVGVLGRPARHDRDWYPYLARTTKVDLTSAGFSVAPVTDWRYDARDATAQAYAEASYRFDQLKKVWFLLEPQPGMEEDAAHTFLLFEFDDGKFLGITIEARRERYEDYAAWDGLWNAYELSYVWGSAHDLLTRRAVMLNHQVFMYPLKVSEVDERDVLLRLLARTHALENTPRYYNTLTSNCTNELAKATRLKWDVSFILTAKSDNHLFTLGLIPGADFPRAEKTANISDFIRANNNTADFDGILLAEMRKRWGEDAT